MTIKLSILVLTVPSRIQAFFPKLMMNLHNQAKPYTDVEIIALYDNKKRSIGRKRNDIMKMAQGEYLVFIDDDDRIADDYIDQVMRALYENPTTDCVVFDAICKIDNGCEKLCKWGIEFERGDILDGKEWRGKPAHTTVYRSTIAKKHEYADMSNGEDYDWVDRACLDIKEQTRIEKILYYYDANYSTTSESTGLDDETIQHNINLILENGDVCENVNEPKPDYLTIYNTMFSLDRYNNHPTNEFRYEVVKEYISKNIDQVKTLVDIGSGKGTMLQILSDNFSDIKLTSCDLNKYHNLDVDFNQLDLSDPSKYIYFPVNDLLICLDVLEHLDKSFIEDVLKYFSVISKNSILTVANHSDIIDGIELHTIREDDSYWTPLISKYFTIHRINEHYHQFGKPLLYIYYLTSNNINT